MSHANRTPHEQPYPPEEADVVAELVDTGPSESRLSVGRPAEAEANPLLRIRRRRKLPLVLFLVTCVSTYFAGATGWLPSYYLLQRDYLPMRRAILCHWQEGLIYMICVLAILLTHEFGHFLATVRYRIPASFPFFLPFPISSIGTMGAVIAMDGRRADRRQTFDIGLAGPLAGLVVAVPVLWLGILKLDFTVTPHGPFALECPLAVRLILDYLSPTGYQPGAGIVYSQLNPYFMAGWVGLLITGLNMMPVSQLDGGHVLYTLFGCRSRWIARGFLALAVAFIVWEWSQAWPWTLMVIILLLIGPDHPPTRDDSVPLGWWRTALGWLSLSIPVLCFPPHALQMLD